ncbi:MAG: MerR family transcriptional regulator [Pseudonocardiaceae bacterium]
MRIGELSRQTGVAAHLLRHYEAQGLLEVGREANGYRQYASEAVLTVIQIRGLLEAGLSTEDIRLLLPCATGTAPDLEPCPELLATLRTRLHGLEQRIDTLTHSLPPGPTPLSRRDQPPAHAADEVRRCQHASPVPMRSISRAGVPLEGHWRSGGYCWDGTTW